MAETANDLLQTAMHRALAGAQKLVDAGDARTLCVVLTRADGRVFQKSVAIGSPGATLALVGSLVVALGALKADVYQPPEKTAV